MPTSSDRAYKHIKESILSGRFRSGERLPEVVIADELVISRTPIRDALRRLQSEGFVEIKPNSGARVVSTSESELNEMTQMRVLLEGFAAELAATRIDADTIEQLEVLCADMEAAIDAQWPPDLDRFSQRNLAFHQKVVRAASNARLSSAVELLWAFPLMLRKYALFDRERMQRSLEHHREIVAALKARDANWAGAIMRTHIIAAQAYDALLGGNDE